MRFLLLRITSHYLQTLLQLRKENTAVTGVIRSSGIDFSVLLIVLRKNWLIKLDWGNTVAEIIDNVLCIGW